MHGIVRQNGGVVRVASEPGHGTTVKVYLPQVEPEEETPADPRSSSAAAETVLVAEDEEGVRELLRKVLGDHGHPVLEARHGRDALMVAERYERPIDLLIADVVMPEIGGGELVERLTSQRPDLKVLYISGYTNDEIVRRGVRRTRGPLPSEAVHVTRADAEGPAGAGRRAGAAGELTSAPGPAWCEARRGRSLPAGASGSLPSSNAAAPPAGGVVS